MGRGGGWGDRVQERISRIRGAKLRDLSGVPVGWTPCGEGDIIFFFTPVQRTQNGGIRKKQVGPFNSWGIHAPGVTKPGRDRGLCTAGETQHKVPNAQRAINTTAHRLKKKRADLPTVNYLRYIRMTLRTHGAILHLAHDVSSLISLLGRPRRELITCGQTLGTTDFVFSPLLSWLLLFSVCAKHRLSYTQQSEAPLTQWLEWGEVVLPKHSRKIVGRFYSKLLAVWIWNARLDKKNIFWT